MAAGDRAYWSDVFGRPLCLMTTTAAETIPHATYTQVPLTTASEDTDEMASIIGGGIYCRTAGLYRVGAAVGFTLQATGSRALVVYRDGTAARVGVAVPATPSGISPRLSASGLIRLTVGDYLEIFVWQNSGGPLSLYNQFGFAAVLEVEWVPPCKEQNANHRSAPNPGRESGAAHRT